MTTPIKRTSILPEIPDDEESISLAALEDIFFKDFIVELDDPDRAFVIKTFYFNNTN